MTPVFDLDSVFWVFLGLFSKSKTRRSWKLPLPLSLFALSLSLSGYSPEGHKRARENGTIRINVEMKLNYKERKTLSLSKKNSVRFFLSGGFVGPDSSLLFPLFSSYERCNSRKTQAERTREKQEEKEKNKTIHFHWLPPSHVETFFQFLRAGLLQCPFGKYAAAVLDEKPLCGSDHAYSLSKAPGLREGASSVMLCSQPCHSAGTDVGSWPRWQSSSP